MADGTQSEGPRGDPSRGAAESAPTAPHATPRGGRGSGLGAPRTGPERFWRPEWRRALGLACLVASLVVHYELSPWTLLPEHEFEIRDTVGDLSIPIDLLEGDTAEAPAAPPLPPPPAIVDAVHPRVENGAVLDAGAPRPPHDAGTVRVLRDGGPDAAPRPKRRDAGQETRDASPRDAAPRDAGVGRVADAAVARAGQASGVARDAVGMVGAAGGAQAGPQLVVVTINMAAIRTHPVGSRIGPLFAAIPQWDDFLVGTGVDPLRDTDWVMINGPSLIHSEHDVIIVHYSAPDALVDRALASIAHKSSNGGPYDAGVAGVKSVIGHADRADRVFMRPQAHVVAVVPPSYAEKAAETLSRATIPRATKRAAEALRMTLVHPHGPMPAIPESVTELRLWVVPHNATGGADVYGEGDTASPDACRAAVATLTRLVADQNSFGVKLITHGLLDGVELTPDGSTLRMHIPVTREQLEVLLAFAAGRLGVDLAPRDGGAPPPRSPATGH